MNLTNTLYIKDTNKRLAFNYLTHFYLNRNKNLMISSNEAQNKFIL